ncbi:hypothetical protein ACFFMP_17625 [Pseudoroseomonas cervicalis]|uniref:Uncharacterized protein n=1 Tax=Pseudoroseomonas cervicalis ATCC 49957 TaxID=525371 RepID=D5RLZ9_9PROT|nr:hypothetical protein [Pseudoroseomonas cervicalis]EFH11671.1 hypothetical protein HMPREF0731_2110 [Pseudoroseomonas cervicalis ATCC 49957]
MASLSIATRLDRAAAPPPPQEPSAAGPVAAQKDMFSWTVLPRHGQRPLQLPARLLLEANSEAGGCDIWSEIAVLETLRGDYVAVLRHRRERRGLPSFQHAEICPDAESIREVFEGHDPVATLPVEALVGPLPDHAVPEDLIALADREASFQRARWKELLRAVFGAPRGAPASHRPSGAATGAMP